MGGILGGGGGSQGTSTTTSTARALEPEEKELIAAQTEFQKLVTAFLPEQQEAERSFFAFTEEQQEVQRLRFAEEEAIREEQKLEFADIKEEQELFGGENLDQLVDSLTSQQFELGKTRLLEAQQDQFEQLNEVFAPSRGLRGANTRTGEAADSPIIDRGGRIARETTRQLGGLEQTLSSAAANFKLSLRQTNIANRLQLASLQTGRRLEASGLAPAIVPGAPAVTGGNFNAGGNALSSLLNRPTNTTTTSTQSGGGGSNLAGIGSVLQGIGSLKAFFSCFKAGTLILTPKGPVPIEQLEVGDETAAGTVLAIFSGSAKGEWFDYEDVTVQGYHKVVDMQTGHWVEVQNAELSVPVERPDVYYNLDTTSGALLIQGASKMPFLFGTQHGSLVKETK